MTVQIRFEPDIGTYSVGSMMITPTSQPALIGRCQQVNVPAHAPSRLAQQKSAHVVEVALHRSHSLEHCRARGRQKATDDHVAHFSLGVATDDRKHQTTAHPSALP